MCCVCCLIFVLFHRLAGRRAGCVCVWPSECTHVVYAFSDLGLVTLLELLVGSVFMTLRIVVTVLMRCLSWVEWLVR